MLAKNKSWRQTISKYGRLSEFGLFLQPILSSPIIEFSTRLHHQNTSTNETKAKLPKATWSLLFHQMKPRPCSEPTDCECNTTRQWVCVCFDWCLSVSWSSFVSLFLVRQDFAYHGIAAFFYLSASVALAKVTLEMKDGTKFQNYQLDISAVVSQAFSCWWWIFHNLATYQPLIREGGSTQILYYSLKLLIYTVKILHFKCSSAFKTLLKQEM